MRTLVMLANRLKGWQSSGHERWQILVNREPYHTDRIVLMVLISITAIRLLAIWLTPLGPDVEEAQYWLWSQTPDAGYFTKPPMIAWVIGLTTLIFGDTLFGIKFAAPIIQLVIALLIGNIARDIASPNAGKLAALIWITLPGTALGGFIISTDSPMLLFMTAAMAVLTPLAHCRVMTLDRVMLAGIFAGLAMMSKYAAVYLPVGLTLWWLWEGRRHLPLSFKPLAVFILGMAISLAPNIIWNIINGFVTVGHLEHNADIGSQTPSLLRSIGFLAAQAGIAGPVLLALSVAALASCWKDKHARFWIALAAPALIIITGQAFLSNANANWAAASYPPLIVLTACWVAASWQGWRRRLAIVAVGFNTLLTATMIVVSISGSFGALTPASDPLRRLRGWDDHLAGLIPLIIETGSIAVITERRGHASKLNWYLRDTNVAVELIDANGYPENHFEAKHPWQPQPGRPIIFINGDPETGHDDRINFTQLPVISTVQISQKRTRQLYFHPGVER